MKETALCSLFIIVQPTAFQTGIGTGNLIFMKVSAKKS